MRTKERVVVGTQIFACTMNAPRPSVPDHAADAFAVRFHCSPLAHLRRWGAALCRTHCPTSGYELAYCGHCLWALPVVLVAQKGLAWWLAAQIVVTAAPDRTPPWAPAVLREP